MSQLNQLPNLRVEDFPSEQGWINKLFVQLNPFIQSVSNLFNNNIDFSTNIKSISRVYDITDFQEFGFLWSFTDSIPIDVRVIKATKGTQQTPTILLLAWSYNTTTKQITISRMVEVNGTSVSELSGRYQFTIRATV
jgi:hypothetical protein